MVLKIFNTLTRKTENFTPVKEGEVGVYICGLTVYDDMHIGHARTYLAFDTILRYLKFSGYNVRYIQNITDIDDKIIKRASERNLEPLTLSEEFALRELEDQEKLGLIKADVYPKVSQHIEDIVSAVSELIEKEFAYSTESGVYFDVSKVCDYGILSNQNVDQLDQHRIEPNPEKRNPLDFALWKNVSADELGFESPWGFGRPGWHIECSVMSRKYLGQKFDIHAGALDLVFPHHENEVAQSEALTGEKPFVKYWMHTGFLYSTGQKMSKSLGNILSVRDFIEKYSSDALRLFVLQSHYRSQIDYNEDKIVACGKAIDRLRGFRETIVDLIKKNGPQVTEKEGDQVNEFKDGFISSMDDDFDTPKAVASLFDFIRRINHELSGETFDSGYLKQILQTFDELTSVLGFAFNEDELSLGLDVETLISERNRFRDERDWENADKIRETLLDMGIKLEDRKDGKTVAKKIC